MKGDETMTDTDLDHLFAAARAHSLPPGNDLMARVLADALAEQPRAAAGPVPVPVLMPMPIRSAPRRGLWARLAEAVGGRGVLAGLGGAACFGLVIGYADPTALGWLTGGFVPVSVTEVQLLPGTDFFLSEG